MTQLWTPFEQYDKEREAVIDRARSQAREAQRVTAELKKVDPYLDVVFVGPRGSAPGVHPNRWHVRRQPPDAMDTYWPITGENGSYLEPGQHIIEHMKEADLWRRGALQELRDRIDRKEKADAKQKELTREQIRDESAVTYRAAKRVAGEGGMRRRRWGVGVVGH